jgi:hypothetical protein
MSVNVNDCLRIIAFEVDQVLQHGTDEQAMQLMAMLRTQSIRLDHHLTDAHDMWNRVQS